MSGTPTSACRLLPAGIALDRVGQPLLAPVPDWLEVRIGEQATFAEFARHGGGVRAMVGALVLSVRQAADPGPEIDLRRVTVTVQNTSAAPVALNLKWHLPLADQDAPPRWLIPALLYKDNVQFYPGLPSLVPPFDLAHKRWPEWTFRADLTAVPTVMAWTGGGSVAMLLEERTAGHMTGLGLVNVAGRRALVGCWPYREEPCPRATATIAPDQAHPTLEFATLAPGATVRIAFWLYVGGPLPYAFAPLLRETFRRWDDRFPLHPWFPLADGAAHAAYGLFQWHYDAESAALWETCSYDRYYAKNARHVDRFEMHTGFVSGIPYAYALRQFGLKHGAADFAEAGRRVIDNCCRHLTPWGTFWSKFSQAEGWTTGWPSPQNLTDGNANLGSASREIQARTIAEATLFAARAALAEPVAESRELWNGAVRSNLDFVLRTQRPDGNVGQTYSGTDGAVLAWDGDEGLHWIGALVAGWRLTGEAKYLDAAVRAGEYYRLAVEDAYITGAPEGMHLLPTSEDPLNALIGYLALHDATGERRWLGLARLAAEYLMTFRWQYNTEFSAMTVLERYDYRTKGLDVASPNNIHLHPYGLIVVPELVRLWELTGDPYFLKQARNNLLGCQQMLAPADGVFDARRGMMTERWYATPGDIAKGGTLQLAHAWATGLVLYADLWVQEYGQLLVDGDTGELVALDAVEAARDGAGWRVTNPWPQALALQVVVRNAAGTLAVAGQEATGDGTLLRVPFVLAAGVTATLAWVPAPPP